MLLSIYTKAWFICGFWQLTDFHLLRCLLNLISPCFMKFTKNVFPSLSYLEFCTFLASRVLPHYMHILSHSSSQSMEAFKGLFLTCFYLLIKTCYNYAFSQKFRLQHPLQCVHHRFLHSVCPVWPLMMMKVTEYLPFRRKT